MTYVRNLEEDIKRFQGRFAEERDFCEELYEYASVRLLAHKYLYYEKNVHMVDDSAYDNEEYSWFVMGRALGHLKEDESSPCVGFDYKLPLADKAIATAEDWIARKWTTSNRSSFHPTGTSATTKPSSTTNDPSAT